MTEVTEVVIPEKKRVRRYVGRKVVKTPKYLKRDSETVFKKALKKLTNKKIRQAGNTDDTAASVKHNGHKRFFDPWWNE